MPATVTWGNEELTYMCYTFTDPWTWDDFYNFTLEGRIMRENANVPSIVI